MARTMSKSHASLVGSSSGICFSQKRARWQVLEISQSTTKRNLCARLGRVAVVQLAARFRMLLVAVQQFSKGARTDDMWADAPRCRKATVFDFTALAMSTTATLVGLGRKLTRVCFAVQTNGTDFGPRACTHWLVRQNRIYTWLGLLGRKARSVSSMNRLLWSRRRRESRKTSLQWRQIQCGPSPRIASPLAWESTSMASCKAEKEDPSVGLAV